MTHVEPAETPRLDVRGMRKPDKHPAIFQHYAKLEVGESFVLINDHDPKNLREEFEIDHAGSYAWDYLTQEPRNWQIKITKLAATPLPRVVVDTHAIGNESATDNAIGAAWKLEIRDRHLDSNVIVLPAGEGIDSHNGPDLDVLILILGGGGQLETELDAIDLVPGQLVWLPRRSRRQFSAGPDGLKYLTVHQKREALVLQTNRSDGVR